MKRILTYIAVILSILILIIISYFEFGDCGIAPWDCGEYPTQGDWTTQKIQVMDGPEDMAIDTSMGNTRIIVSCSARRGDKGVKGSFVQINTHTNEAQSLTIVPANLSIRPHGIDVVDIDGTPYLYAISHDSIDGNVLHRILRFTIKGDSLYFDESAELTHPLLTGPNDLDVLEDGSLYVTNPMPTNHSSESTKAILGMKTGNVLHFDGKNTWSIVIEGLCYPNGIWVDKENDQLLLANGACQEVASYKIENGKVNQLAKTSSKSHDIEIPIGDNLMIDQEGVLWVAAHPCPLKYLEHAKESKNHSPVQIFAMNPKTLAPSLIFQNNGELISAASTALRIGNRLYISQIFDPFVLVMNGVKL